MFDEYFETKIHKLIPLKYRQYYVYIPQDYDSELKDYILAALAHKHTGIVSADYLRKRYIEPYKIESKKKDISYYYSHLFERILNSCCQSINEIYKSFYAVNYKQQSISSLAVDSTISRLINSYECSLFLIRNGFYYESYSIIRLIFEQLSYCAIICDITNEEYNNMSKKKSQLLLDPTNIKKIKRLFSDFQIGKLYSELSQRAHIDPVQVSNFIDYDNQDDCYVIVSKNVRQSIEAALTLLQIIDIHSFIFEYSLRNHISAKHKYIVEDNSVYKFKSKRKLKFQIQKYFREFDTLLEKEKITIKDPESVLTRSRNYLKSNPALD